MKVLSLLQPWASLVVMGYKKIETRSWNTKYRGDLLIHASLPRKHAIELAMQHPFYECIGGLRGAYDLPVGAIIGKVKLIHTFPTNCVLPGDYEEVNVTSVSATTFTHLSAKERSFGDYSDNRYGWLLSDPVQFKKPIPAKGSLSIWELPAALEPLIHQ